MENISRIVTWIFSWPFSAIDNIVGDLIDAVTSLVKNYLIGIYEGISKKYLDELIREGDADGE